MPCFFLIINLIIFLRFIFSIHVQRCLLYNFLSYQLEHFLCNANISWKVISFDFLQTLLQPQVNVNKEKEKKNWIASNLHVWYFLFVLICLKKKTEKKFTVHLMCYFPSQRYKDNSPIITVWTYFLNLATCNRLLVLFVCFIQFDWLDRQIFHLL